MITLVNEEWFPSKILPLRNLLDRFQTLASSYSSLSKQFFTSISMSA